MANKHALYYAPAKSAYAIWKRNHTLRHSPPPQSSQQRKRTSSSSLFRTTSIMILFYTLWKKNKLSKKLLPSWILVYLRQKYQSIIRFVLQKTSLLQQQQQRYIPRISSRGVVLPTKQILDYWFGQYESIHECHIKLWMIPHQDAVHRQKVDDEIYTQFGIQYLTTTTPTTPSTDEINNDWQDIMACIILYDQMSRHVHRHLQTTSTNTNNSIILSQEECDVRAKKYSQLFLEKYKREMNCGRIALPYIIFGIMPLRHSSTKDEYQYLLDSLLPQIQKTHLLDCTNLFSRFKTATQRRYTHLLDEYRHTHNDENSGEDYDILEHEYVPLSRTEVAMKHIVTRTIQSFFHTHNLLRGTVVISLSGGVDSMVIASVLSLLKQYDKKFESLQVVAVHLNYGNRPESTAEATYVEWYATQICKFDDYKVCHIQQQYPHLIRTKMDRTEYENQTRQIRFDLYQSIQSNKGVLLGHHIGDIRENVISNVHRGCSLLELSGMTDISVQNGTTILRPLLPLEKSSIFDYSHLFGVPYFKDTTPLWSTRGKLRTKLLPLLQDMYGPGSMNHLTNLAHQSDDFAVLMKESFINPMTSSLVSYKMGLSLHCMPGKSIEVWKLVLKQLLHSHGLGMWTNKSVASFHQRVFADNGTKLGWLQCRKDYGVYVEPTTLQMYIFYPSSFPWNTKQQYTYNNNNNEKLEYDTVYHVGPWNILLQRDDNSNNNNNNNLLEKKAISSMDHFMMGTIIYYLPPSNTGYIFVPSYTKATRPSAWKHIDLRIQQTLPLVGSPTTTSQQQQHQQTYLTKVTMSLDPISTTIKEEVESNNNEERKDNSLITIETDKNVNETSQQVKETKPKNGEKEKDDSTIVKESDDPNTARGTKQEKKTDKVKTTTTTKKENQTKKNEKTKDTQPNKDKEQMENLWEALIQPFVKRE